MNQYLEIVLAYLIYFICYVFFFLLLENFMLANTFAWLAIFVIYFIKIFQPKNPKETVVDWQKHPYLERIGAVCGYLLCGIAIPLVFTRKNSSFCYFHVQQAFIVQFLVIGHTQFLLFMLGELNNGFNLALAGTLMTISSLIVGFYLIFGIVNSILGKEKELPILGKIKVFPEKELEEEALS